MFPILIKSYGFPDHSIIKLVSIPEELPIKLEFTILAVNVTEEQAAFAQELYLPNAAFAAVDEVPF